MVTTDPRPSFDDIYMRFTIDLARRSTCSRSRVGCIIVSEENDMPLSIGYNGGAKGEFNECLSSEPGKCGHLHAEINAIIKLNYRDAAQRKAYVTMEPCFNCAVALINAKVSEVIYHDEYRLHDGLELLKRAGVTVRRHVLPVESRYTMEVLDEKDSKEN